MAAWFETQKIPSLLSPGQGKSANKDVFTITVTFVQHKNVPKTDEDGGDHTSVKSTMILYRWLEIHKYTCQLVKR